MKHRAALPAFEQPNGFAAQAGKFGQPVLRHLERLAPFGKQAHDILYLLFCLKVIHLPEHGKTAELILPPSVNIC